MNGCSDVQSKVYRVSGRPADRTRDAASLPPTWKIAGSVRGVASVRQMQASLAALGPVPEPEDLLLRIRVAVSQERARSRQSAFPAGTWPGEIPWALSAAGLGRLCQRGAAAGHGDRAGHHVYPAGGSAGQQGRAPGQRNRAASALSLQRRWQQQIGDISGPVVVEAYINGAGQVYDYRIVSGPTDEATRAQVENLLLFSVFEPARFFGQPVRGLAVLSFSGVSVRG